MADRKTLKKISRSWLKTAELLINNKDWDMATYMMCHSLECALKAVICKTLHLTTYPKRSGRQDDHFFVHRFDILLRLAGLEDIFGTRGVGFQVWSDFTTDLPTEWVVFRYEPAQFDETKVRWLHKCLTDRTPGSEGIFTLLTKKKRW